MFRLNTLNPPKKSFIRTSFIIISFNAGVCCRQISLELKKNPQPMKIVPTSLELITVYPSPFLIHYFIIGFVTRLTRRVTLVKQELLTLPEHLSSSPVFSGVRVTRSLVLYVCFVDRCLSFCTFSFDHCVFCSSSIYQFWLPPFGIFKLFLLPFLSSIKAYSLIQIQIGNLIPELSLSGLFLYGKLFWWDIILHSSYCIENSSTAIPIIK